MALAAGTAAGAAAAIAIFQSDILSPDMFDTSLFTDGVDFGMQEVSSFIDGIDLAESVAYADSASDLPMLEAARRRAVPRRAAPRVQLARRHGGRRARRRRWGWRWRSHL